MASTAARAFHMLFFISFFCAVVISWDRGVNTQVLARCPYMRVIGPMGLLCSTFFRGVGVSAELRTLFGIC
jgi:hypothetical protein